MRNMRPPAATGRLYTCADGRLCLPQLRGGEGTLRQTRVAETDLDLDKAVPSDARAHGQRQLAKNELEMRDLQSFCREGDLAVGGQRGGIDMGGEGDLGLGSRNDENRSLNTEHVYLFKGHGWLRPSGQSPGAG
jgi:hypothetical protein